MAGIPDIAPLFFGYWNLGSDAVIVNKTRILYGNEPKHLQMKKKSDKIILVNLFVRI